MRGVLFFPYFFPKYKDGGPEMQNDLSEAGSLARTLEQPLESRPAATLSDQAHQIMNRGSKEHTKAEKHVIRDGVGLQGCWFLW